MGSFHPERRVFRRGDNVLGYWVDHAEGFEIRSGVRFRARVEAVVVDPRRGRAKALIVRSARLHRRRLIPVEAAVAVDPFRRRIEIERGGPRRVARASRSLVQLVAAAVAGMAGLAAWSGPRLRQLAALADEGARGIASRAAAASAWVVPRAKTVGVAALTLGLGLVLRAAGALARGARSIASWSGPRLAAGARNARAYAATAVALGFGLALRFGGALLALAKGIAAWSSLRLSAGASSARTQTATAVVWLGPRLSNQARTASRRAIAVGRAFVLGADATASWIAPRLRASAEAVAWATLTLGSAVAAAVHLVGTRLSEHVRYVSDLRRN
jgi:hypothetical protein